ncbi:MAG: hypothetical protein AAF911_11395 [Planctomycetota bacterium]
MSQFSSSNYEVQKTSGVCAATGDTLEPGVGCYSALVDIPAEEREANDELGMKRLDVSQGAWEDGFRPPHLFSFWKTTVPEANAKKKMFVDDSVLLNLLRRLEDATEPQRLAFRFVVALILMRKKLLRYDATERVDDPEGDGPVQEWWRFTPKLDVSKGHFGKWNEDEQISVLDPRLDESQIEQVTTQLGEILEAEL